MKCLPHRINAKIELDTAKPEIRKSTLNSIKANLKIILVNISEPSAEMKRKIV
jgi:hypothetical protein